MFRTTTSIVLLVTVPMLLVASPSMGCWKEVDQGLGPESLQSKGVDHAGESLAAPPNVVSNRSNRGAGEVEFNRGQFIKRNLPARPLIRVPEANRWKPKIIEIEELLAFSGERGWVPRSQLHNC